MTSGMRWWNVRIRIGSKFAVEAREFKVKKHDVLPLSIAVMNQNAARTLMVQILESDRIPPVADGFQILDGNPVRVGDFMAGENKIVRVNIQINTEKHQYIKIRVVDDKQEVLQQEEISLNNPACAGKPFKPFDESALLKPSTMKGDLID